MDTVYVLIGKIGKANLSTQAKKRLSKLNELNDVLDNLEKALEEAEGAHYDRTEREVAVAQTMLTNYEEDFREFLDDELVDLTQKQIALTEKVEAERLAEVAKNKEKTEAEKKEAKKLADEEAERLAEEETERLAEEEAEKLAKEQAKAGNLKNPDSKKKKSGIGLGTVIVAGIVLAITAGTINMFRNR